MVSRLEYSWWLFRHFKLLVGCSEWLLGGCYVLSWMLWVVVANVLFGGF